MDHCSHCSASMDHDERFCPQCGFFTGVDVDQGEPAVDFLAPPSHAYMPDRDAMLFPALVNGNPVKCLITLAALRRGFGVMGKDLDELEQAFAAKRKEIEAMTRLVIRQRRSRTNGELVISLRDLS